MPPIAIFSSPALILYFTCLDINGLVTRIRATFILLIDVFLMESSNKETESYYMRKARRTKK